LGHTGCVDVVDNTEANKHLPEFNDLRKKKKKKCGISDKDRLQNLQNLCDCSLYSPSRNPQNPHLNSLNFILQTNEPEVSNDDIKQCN
jgi:hypothetical protein